MIIAAVGLIGLIVWKFVVKKYFLKNNENNNDSTGSDSPTSEK